MGKIKKNQKKYGCGSTEEKKEHIGILLYDTGGSGCQRADGTGEIR